MGEANKNWFNSLFIQEVKAALTRGYNCTSSDHTPADVEFFDINYDGVVSLKKEYRVNGGKYDDLPEKIIIPDFINGIAVVGFSDGIFQSNKKVRELTVPSSVTKLPKYFCYGAKNLTAVKNTEQITELGDAAFGYTSIRKAEFPNLEKAGKYCFLVCPFLYILNIGNKIKTIEQYLCDYCISLSAIIGGKSIETIESYAFRNTYNLKNWILPETISEIKSNAFSSSRIQFDWSSLKNCKFGTDSNGVNNATPVGDNIGNEYWLEPDIDNEDSTEPYKPGSVNHGVVSVLNQRHPDWKDHIWPAIENGEDARFTLSNGCSLFSIAHIHSILSNTKFNSFQDFLDDVNNRIAAGTTDSSVLNLYTPLAIRANAFLQELGYNTTFYSDYDPELGKGTGEPTIDKIAYQKICKAINKGACLYVAKSTSGDVNGGHAVAVYGINEIGEMLVVDSDTQINNMDTYDEEFMTYSIPLQNLTGPCSDIIIVEKPV